MTTALSDAIQGKIRWVPDFPTPGVHFADLTPVLADSQIFNDIAREMADKAGDSELIAGLDARGFLIAAGVAVLKGVGCCHSARPASCLHRCTTSTTAWSTARRR